MHPYAARPLLSALLVLAAAAPAPAPPDPNSDPLPEGAVARIGSARLRHGGRGDTASFSPDGKRIAAPGRDGVLRIWDGATGKLLHRIDGIHPEARHPAFSADGGTIVCWDRKNALIFWDAASGKEVRRIAGEGAVFSPLLSPDGKTLAYDSAHMELIFVDAASGKTLRRVGRKPVNIEQPGGPPRPVISGDLQYAPSGPALFTPDGKLLIGRLGDVYEVNTGKLVHQLRQRYYDAFAAALINGGKTLITLDVSEDGELSVAGVSAWDLATGKRRQRPFPGPKVSIAAAAVSPDGKLLASAADRVRIYDAATGKPLRDCEFSGEAVGELAFSPDGKTLASQGPAQVTLWDTATGKLRLEQQRGSFVAALASAPGGKTVAAAQGSAIRIHDAGNGKVLKEIAAPAHVTALALAPDGKTVASGDLGGMVRLWDAATGKERARWKCNPDDLGTTPVGTLALSHDGKRLAGGTRYDAGIRLWDAATGKPLAHLEKESHLTRNVAFSPDGRHWAAGTMGGYTFVFASADNAKLRTLGHNSAGLNDLLSLTFSPDGSAAAWSQPGWSGLEVALLDSPSLPRRGKDVPKIPATAVAFLPDGWALALGRADGTIILWDPAEGQEGPKLASDAGAVQSLAILGGGRLVSRHENGTALVWDVSAWLKPRARALTAAQREEHWSALASVHGLDAFRAMGSLARDGKGGVAFLAEKVRTTAGKMPSFKSLLDDLGGGSVLRQVYAKRELVGLGERAAPHLRHALGKASPELKKRIEEALAEIAAKSGKRADEGDLGAPVDLVRCSRGLAVLARAGTAEARKALEELARGGSGMWLGDEARAALERLKRGAP